MNVSGSEHNGNHWLSVTIVGVSFAVLGWLVGFSVTHYDTISELWFQASEQKYLTMTGKVGPVTYLVEHTNYDAVEAMAFARDDILGVELYRYPNKAAVAFTGSDSAGIEAMANADYVVSMRQKIIPMMCH